MTCLELEFEEFWAEVDLGPELTERMKQLGDRAAWLHEYTHGPGGDWNGRPDFYCCFGG